MTSERIVIKTILHELPEVLKVLTPIERVLLTVQGQPPAVQYRALLDAGLPIPNWPSDDQPSGLEVTRMEGGLPVRKE